MLNIKQFLYANQKQSESILWSLYNDNHRNVKEKLYLGISFHEVKLQGNLCSSFMIQRTTFLAQHAALVFTLHYSALYLCLHFKKNKLLQDSFYRRKEEPGKWICIITFFLRKLSTFMMYNEMHGMIVHLNVSKCFNI